MPRRTGRRGGAVGYPLAVLQLFPYGVVPRPSAHYPEGKVPPHVRSLGRVRRQVRRRLLLSALPRRGGARSTSGARQADQCRFSPTTLSLCGVRVRLGGDAAREALGARAPIGVGAHSSLESSPALAISAARSSARALMFVSFHSLSGTESATMPAAACACSMPSFNTAVRIAIARSMSPW